MGYQLVLIGPAGIAAAHYSSGGYCSATVSCLGLCCSVFKLELGGSQLYIRGGGVIRRQARRIDLATTQGLLREGEYQVYLAIASLSDGPRSHSF
jgi:hypothetical protein